MTTKQVLFGLVFAILICGIFAGSVNALKRVDVVISPDVNDITPDKYVSFKATVTNTGDEILPKETRIDSKIFRDNYLRVMYKNAFIGPINVGQSKSIRLGSIYSVDGRYLFLTQVHIGDHYVIAINGNSNFAIQKEFEILKSGTVSSDIKTAPGRVDLSISPDTNAIKVGDKVKFKAIVTNRGSVETAPATRLYLRLYKDSKRVRYINKYISYLDPEKSRTLTMGSYTFKEPGTYKLIGQVYIYRPSWGDTHQKYPYYINGNSDTVFTQEFVVQ